MILSCTLLIGPWAAGASVPGSCVPLLCIKGLLIHLSVCVWLCMVCVCGVSTHRTNSLNDSLTQHTDIQTLLNKYTGTSK